MNNYVRFFGTIALLILLLRVEFFVRKELKDISPPEGCQWVEMVEVVDGDTIIVGDQTKVRFLSTDAPETVHPDKPATLRGYAASAWLKFVLRDDKIICLEYSHGQTTHDKYGRVLADVYTENNIDISRRMVKLNLAEPW